MTKKKNRVQQEDDVLLEKAELVEETFAENREEVTASEPVEPAEKAVETEKSQTVETPVAAEPKVAEAPKQKSGGKGIALLALLVALGIGGAGYYFGQLKFSALENEVAKLANRPAQAGSSSVEIPTFEAEKTQIAELTANYQKSLEKIAQLEQAQSNYTSQINDLQIQLSKVNGAANKADAGTWLLSDANFLLKDAVRKLVVDNDVETAVGLLKEADNALSRVTNAQVAPVREAIQADLAQLNKVNKVDQNGLMQRLSHLANNVDDLALVDQNVMEQAKSSDVSDSINDWQQNIEKSASSFLDHFIRISDRNKADEKAIVAPNQEIYLRENIRLRLQIAILAVTRQQNDLYKQSLDAVATWVRSYFDANSENVKSFLKEIDDLAEQSIYVDAPDSLQSLSALDSVLQKKSSAVEKVQLEVDKALTEETPKAEEKPAQPAEQTQPAPAPAQ